MREFCVGDPMRPIFHLFALGVCVGGNANLSIRVGANAKFRVFRYHPQHKTLALGVLPNVAAQRECFHVAVEYRL